AAATILRARPHVQLLAVGPNEDARWRDLRAATGGRARALGPRHDLPRIHAAADVYLEGFPVGSPTALLEAGLRGLACVRAPADVPPPFAIDGPALDALAQPTARRWGARWPTPSRPTMPARGGSAIWIGPGRRCRRGMGCTRPRPSRRCRPRSATSRWPSPPSTTRTTR